MTGIYMYDGRVFDYCRDLKPSLRGELEITDVNNAYVAAGDLRYDVLERLVDRRRAVREPLPRNATGRGETHA